MMTVLLTGWSEPASVVPRISDGRAAPIQELDPDLSCNRGYMQGEARMLDARNLRALLE